MVKEILLLGNPKLYDICAPVNKAEYDLLRALVDDLHDTLMDFRKRYGAGRAIAAPQIGVMIRVIYMFMDSPVIFLNPNLREKSKEMMPVWDDCMCFPDLLVKVERHRTCTISYRNMDWKEQEMRLEGDLSELLQHEYDHLDGILAVSRALDGHSFALRSQKKYLHTKK
jgi:peptide deformylase